MKEHSVTVRLSESEVKALKEAARLEHRTLSNQLRVYILESTRRRGIPIREN